MNCSVASAFSGLGNLLIAPACLLGVFFVLYFIFGPGRGQISSLIETFSFFFGTGKRAATVGLVLLVGAVGGGLIAAANYYGHGCAL